MMDKRKQSLIPCSNLAKKRRRSHLPWLEKQEKTQQSPLSWSDLLEELLSLISTKLRLSECLNFQLVCTSWKRAAKRLTQCLDSPLFMLPCEDNQRFFLCPFDEKFYKSTTQDESYMRYKCLGSFHGWLLMIDGFSEDKICLINPFTGARIDLPHWDRTHNIKRVALSSVPTNPNCTVIITLDDIYWCFKFCRVGDTEWTMEESDSIMMDAIFFRDTLYILGSEKPVYKSTTTNIILTHLKEYLGLPLLDGSFYDLHLVESGGELLLVLRKDRAELISTNSFIVFKLDPLTSSWAQMKKIGNRVLFLGKSCSKSFSASELGCSENQIYFIDPSDYESSAWLVFNMEDGSIQSVLLPLQGPVCVLDDPWETSALRGVLAYQIPRPCKAATKIFSPCLQCKTAMELGSLAGESSAFILRNHISFPPKFKPKRPTKQPAS